MTDPKHGGRPAARPKQTCPMTGLQACYLDPRTQVPFANAGAYQTLTNVLEHCFIWSERLECYVGKEGERMATDRCTNITNINGTAKEKRKDTEMESKAMDTS